MKFIKDLICKIFHIKACQCREEMDEHVEFFTKVPKSEIPTYELPVDEEKSKHCGSHTRFIKSCHQCLAVTK